MGEAQEEKLVLTDEDKQNMRIFLEKIFDQNPAIVDQWKMNERVFEIIKDIVVEGGACSDHMELVPQPGDLIGGRGGVKYVKKVLQAIAKRVAKDRVKDTVRGEKKIHFTCKRFLARNYATALRMAGMGL